VRLVRLPGSLDLRLGPWTTSDDDYKMTPSGHSSVTWHLQWPGATLRVGHICQTTSNACRSLWSPCRILRHITQRGEVLNRLDNIYLIPPATGLMTRIGN